MVFGGSRWMKAMSAIIWLPRSSPFPSNESYQPKKGNRRMSHASQQTTGSHVLLPTLIDLLRRPSPSGQEELVRAYVLKHLHACGCTLTVDGAGNVLAVRGVPAPG